MRYRLSTRHLRVCLMLGVIVTPSGAARAQERVATTQEEVASEQEGSAANPRPWRLEVIAGGGYDDNIRFTPSTESAVSGRLRASLTRLITTSRASLTLGAAGEKTVYRDFQDFNRLNYAVDFSGSYLLSPRTTIRISDSLSKSDTGDSQVLVAAGLFLPRTASRSNAASLEATHQISPSWNWTVSAQHQVVEFDSDLAIGGSTLIGRAGVSWTPARESPVGLSYEFARTSPQGQPGSDLHGATLAAERRFGETLSLRVALGAQQLVSHQADFSHLVMTGSAGFAVRSATQAIEASVARSVGEAFGLGRLQRRSAASLRFARTFTPWLVFGLNASLGRSEDPGGDPDLSFDTSSLGGELGFLLPGNVELLATGGYRDLDPSVVGSTRSRFATLSLKVGQNW